MGAQEVKRKSKRMNRIRRREIEWNRGIERERGGIYCGA